ncbi:lipopolysaccharide assembly protein LapB [Staphylococcus haemolyticus]|uniref:tetratricopeptide repeat protein n=1 Tax=Staphylococcus haemolyticus TaxID=1283 RepID=UPI00069D144E|nr:tetratricopeptide repeat protein [Staphylococcus haemolyticus]MBY6179024.1 tetratricopeptide repeat protein [Staphylococcaceae bacterium DP2N0-1]MCH4389577.1 tetratricopeptide repeat protein [Staphylococcus haemolyticus]MCH4403865.1 tetratricopeptide repeat protein [Staphylococcus haemolyticus]MCI2943059.1 tetratricopeptide repeat protein [Staphylococcus haemolyticus]MCI2945671.1 tetratricopeptide repeat protein [Staphylococcus haemolyticus]
MEDIYKLIDDINLQKLDNLDSRVDDALASNNDDALFILGETLYNFGLTPQGLEVFRTLYHKYPDESELLIYFIEGLMSENQTDEALEYLSQVTISTEKLMLEADLYQQINMTEVAIDKLIEARELEPNDPIIHFALAEMLYFDGQYLRATREYEVVLDTGEYEVNGINLFARMADCALQSGNYSDAINLYDEINEDEMTSEDFFKKAIAYEKNDITHEAIKITKNLLSKDPDFIQGYFYLQSLYENEKNFPDAIETGKEGLRLNQFYKELMVSTGSLEIEHGDANEGVELLKQALEVDNAYHEPLLILSDLFRNEEDYEAIIALLSYVDEDDLDPVFMWHLAHAFSQEERDKEAQHFFELAYPTMKTQSAFLSDYYYYLIEIGYKEKAQTILQQLIKMDPSNETWQEEANRLDY